MEAEISMLKKDVKWLKRYAIFMTVLFLGLLLLSFTSGIISVIQAHRFEVIDNNGKVIQVLDSNGLQIIGNYENSINISNNNNQQNIKYLFNRLGGSSGFIQITNLAGENIETINYYSHFDEKIVINGNIIYSYNQVSKEVLFQNALKIGNAETIEKAIDLAIFHYVNNIFEPKRK